MARLRHPTRTTDISLTEGVDVIGSGLSLSPEEASASKPQCSVYLIYLNGGKKFFAQRQRHFMVGQFKASRGTLLAINIDNLRTIMPILD